MAVSLAGKVCLITGASAGIGAATAVCFAKLGAKLSLTGRNAEGLAKTVSQCNIDADNVFTIIGDVTIAEDRERIISETVKRFSKLDVLINNAGIVGSGSIESPGLMEQYDKIMDVNVRAPLHIMHLAVPHLIASKGVIVNISSACGTRAFMNMIVYNASKAAVNHMTTCAALELAPKGVRVNSVNPGLVITDIQRSAGYDESVITAMRQRAIETHPLSAFTGKVCEASEVADAVAFMASDASRYTTGTHLPVDGGRVATCLR